MNRLFRLLAAPPGLDPDEARRRQLLNVLLFGTLICVGLGLAGTLATDVLWLYPGEQYGVLYLAILVALGVVVALLVVNRVPRPGRLPGMAYLALLLLLAAGVDAPREVIAGRGLIWFVLPILAASFLLRPAASFVLAGLSTLVCMGIGAVINVSANFYALLVFFAVALVAWLAASGLERAAKESRLQAYEVGKRNEELRQLTTQLQDTVARQTELLALVRELEVPILPLLPGLIVLPLVGVVDSQRAEAISQALLQGVYAHRAQTTILDLTGFRPTEVTVVQALAQAAKAAELLGTQIIFSGVSTELAQVLAGYSEQLPGHIEGDLQAALGSVWHILSEQAER